MKANWARHLFWTFMSLAVTGVIVIAVAFFYLEIQLPNVETLNNIQLQVPLSVYTSDDELIGEFGEIRRNPVTLDQVPKQLVNAVIATEDQRYYEHPGVDIFGVFRAARELVLTGKKSQGASTITMQVARNFFLTRQKTYGRKFNEMLLALKIDHDLSKEKIMELYLNKIYLGERAYGVGAAAQVYYGKKLSELTLSEIAMIAGLPQAPSRDNPISNPDAAMDRRNHVLQRMYELGYIKKAAYENALKEPNTASYHGQRIKVYAPYVAEMTRAAMYQQYGDAAYTSGFKVYTTINSKLQVAAGQALRDGLLAYDRRHGYRGPEKNLGSNVNLSAWRSTLQQTPVFNHLQPAAVVQVGDNYANALLSNGQVIQIPWSGLSWARRYIDNKYLGATPTQASNVVKVGDVIRVQKTADGQWEMDEVPKVEGAIVAMNPNSGQIVALSGGFSFQESYFNRVIQASRQPGSNFKPFFYSAALDKGYTLATTINDAPIVQEDSSGIWRPVNDTLKFYGPTRLREALIQSRNLVSIRLLRDIGISYALNYVSRFGFDPSTLPHSLSLALGSGVVTPLQIVNGYAVFANGGYRVTPYLIDKVSTEDGKMIYQSKFPAVCTQPNNCNNAAPQVITPQNAYLITSALQDVIRKGTGEGALVLNRTDVAGKTGTTNDQMDAWFSGYNSDLVATVWVGFDQPQSLYEYGSAAAIPIWVQFMQQALQGAPEHTMPEPQGIVTVHIDSKTGLLAGPNDPNAMFELFTQQTAPTQQSDNTSTGPEDSTEENSVTQQLF
jgi:penicillin-binding protein 1A